MQGGAREEMSNRLFNSGKLKYCDILLKNL